MSSCPVCERTFDDSLSNDFVIHVNACLDNQEQQFIPKNFHIEDEARLHPLMKKQREHKQASDCVVCGKKKATAAHIKKCGKQYGVNTSQLIRLVGDNEPTTNSNIQNIVLKDTNLDQAKVVNDLFVDDQLLPKSQNQSTNNHKFNETSSKSNDRFYNSEYTIILDKANDSIKNGNQTKLKVLRKSKSKNNKLPDGFVDDKPIHTIKRKNTVKIKRNPLVKVNLDDIIVQNFKLDHYAHEREFPRSWKMASLNYELTDYIVDGFEEYCIPFDFKNKMNGFEIGVENK